MPRLYISGPVTGIEHDNAEAFIEAQERLEAAGHTATVPHAFIAPGVSWGMAMAVCINRLTVNDGALMLYEGMALLPGWEQSEGARLEKAVAEACGMTVKTVDEWLEEAR